MKRVVLFSFLAMLGLAACSETQYAAHLAKQVTLPSDTPKAVGRFKVGSSYKIQGKRYYPKETYENVETGIASWYGPGFHGKMTANGEIFDKNELTAAHRTLQMPSIVRVTNLNNGRSLILRVNDRGPFSKNRILDVSERAAELLDFKGQGTTKVKVEVLKKESLEVAMAAKRGEDTRGYEVAYNQNRLPEPIRIAQAQPPKAPQPAVQQQIANVAPQPSYKPSLISSAQATQPFPAASATFGAPKLTPKLYIQAGSFSMEQNAMELARKLERHGPSNVTLARVNDTPYYRVRLGPFASATDADAALNALRSGPVPDAKIIAD